MYANLYRVVCLQTTLFSVILVWKANRIELFTRPDNNQKACSEDLKVSIAGCLGSMVGAAGPGVRRSVLHNIEFKNQISHVIFQALEWAGMNHNKAYPVW